MLRHFLSWQVGYIQIGSEQVQIQPVNASAASFDGEEHFVRRKRSTHAARPAGGEVPVERCSVVAGERGSAGGWR